jgi:hypothetical protein
LPNKLISGLVAAGEKASILFFWATGAEAKNSEEQAPPIKLFI